MSAHIRTVLLVLGLSAALIAQTPEEARHSAIEAFYPVMIKSLAEGNFGEARELCLKAREWEPNEPTHAYNLACIESRADNATAAFAALDEAYKLGFSNLELLDTDTDLAAVRDLPQFRQVREQVAARVAGQQPAAPTAPAAPVVPKPGPVVPKPKPVVPTAPAAPKAAPAGAIADPVAASITKDGPVGLFFMTRYWSGLGSLEKVAWYFLPDGRVYRNISLGFSEEELAQHTMEVGKRSWQGNELVISWDSGEVERSEVEIDEGGDSFFWSMGNFTPAQPTADPASLAGTWAFEAGKSTDMLNLHKFKTLVLSADGTFTCDSAFVSAVDDHPETMTTGSDMVTGTWSAGSYWLGLSSGKDGSTSRRIAFGIDKDETPAKPDWLYYGGMLYTRQ